MPEDVSIKVLVPGEATLVAWAEAAKEIAITTREGFALLDKIIEKSPPSTVVEMSKLIESVARLMTSQVVPLQALQDWFNLIVQQESEP